MWKKSLDTDEEDFTGFGNGAYENMCKSVVEDYNSSTNTVNDYYVTVVNNEEENESTHGYANSWESYAVNGKEGKN